MEHASQPASDDLKKWLATGSVNIFGYPFAGKDTQGTQLARSLDAPLIGGGEILRSSQNLPDEAREVMNQGKLAPTEQYMQIVLPYLSQAKYAGRPLVLSSVGRWSGEEKGVIEAAAAAGHPIKAVLLLNLDEREVWRRFENMERAAHIPRGKRHDDAADVIETRLEEFRTKTLPVIEFYRSIGLVIDIDSDHPISEVHQQILTKLEEFASAQRAR